MNGHVSKSPHLEWLLAGLLHHGTWVASAVTGLGIALGLIERYSAASLSGTGVVTAGIALFILLPVLRVLLMLIVFVRERDYRYVMIAALVLLIILLGFVLGTYGPAHVQGPH